MADHHQFVVAADIALEVGLVRQGLDETDVDGVLKHPVLDRFRIADDQARADVGISRLELAEDPGSMNSAIVVEAPTISEPPISPVSSESRTSISDASPSILSA
jgi:hypothetical protein